MAYAVTGAAAENEILAAEGLASEDRLMTLCGGMDSEQPSDLDADLEFLVRAAAQVEQIRKDLGKMGPVIVHRLRRPCWASANSWTRA